MSGVRTIGRRKEQGAFWILGSLVIVLLIAVLALGWLGLVPGLSAMLGANQPKDLGVQYTPSDLASIERKAGIKFEDTGDAPDHPAALAAPATTTVPEPPVSQPVSAESKSLETSFTQEELSAALNSASFSWLPLKDVQIRLSDHVIEISGLLNREGVSEFLAIAGRANLTESSLARVAGYAERLVDNVPIYVKARGGVDNSDLDLELQQLSLGRFNFPPDVLAKIAPSGIHKTIKSRDNFAIQTATPRDGSLAFTGTLPSTIYGMGR
jgi:hypothetical protein